MRVVTGCCARRHPPLVGDNRGRSLVRVRADLGAIIGMVVDLDLVLRVALQAPSLRVSQVRLDQTSC